LEQGIYVSNVTANNLILKGVHMSIASKLIFNTIIDSDLASSITDSLTYESDKQIEFDIQLTSIQKLLEEIEKEKNMTTSISGLDKILGVLGGIPVKILAILVVGFGFFCALIAFVIYNITKIITNPDVLNTTVDLVNSEVVGNLVNTGMSAMSTMSGMPGMPAGMPGMSGMIGKGENGFAGLSGLGYEENNKSTFQFIQDLLNKKSVIQDASLLEDF